MRKNLCNQSSSGMPLGKANIQNRRQSNAKINLEETLNELLDEAVKRGIIEDSIVYRDLFDTKLMNCLMPRPAQVQREFWDAYKEDPEKATDYFYKLSQDSNYIRRYRVKKRSEMDSRQRIWQDRYHDQPVQAGKRPKGYRSCQAGKIQQLSKMSALSGK